MSRTTECTICFETTTHNNFTLSCGHQFHNKCITHWLIKENTCPTCRNPIVISNAPLIPNVEESVSYLEDYSLIISKNNKQILNKTLMERILDITVDEIEKYLDYLNDTLNDENYKDWDYKKESGQKYKCLLVNKKYKGNKSIKSETCWFLLTHIDVFNHIAFFTVDIIDIEEFLNKKFIHYSKKKIIKKNYKKKKCNFKE